MIQTYRIWLGPFDPDLEGEWIDIHKRRSWGVQIDIDDAVARGIRAFNEARAEGYIARWSFADPLTLAGMRAQDADVMTYVLREAERYYQEGRRDPAATKSAAGEIGGGDRPVLDHVGVSGPGPGAGTLDPVGVGDAGGGEGAGDVGS